jgi:FkbM family methyltransferase
MSLGHDLDDLNRRVTKFLGRYRTSISVRMNGRRARLQVRRWTTDSEVTWQCFGLGQYEIPVVMGGPSIHRNLVAKRYAEIVGHGQRPLILDCGANIGASSLWFALKYDKAKIVAIEPAPDNVAMLRRNLSRIPNALVVEAGVGPQDSQMFIEDGGGGAWGYTTVAHNTGLSVAIKSIGSIMREHAVAEDVPFILKIDIEGAEKALFEGSLDAIAEYPIIIFESHDFYMPGKGTSLPFFKFHVENGRDFLFGGENVFSMKL